MRRWRDEGWSFFSLTTVKHKLDHTTVYSGIHEALRTIQNSFRPIPNGNGGRRSNGPSAPDGGTDQQTGCAVASDCRGRLDWVRFLCRFMAETVLLPRSPTPRARVSCWKGTRGASGRGCHCWRLSCRRGNRPQRRPVDRWRELRLRPAYPASEPAGRAGRRASRTRSVSFRIRAGCQVYFSTSGSKARWQEHGTDRSAKKRSAYPKSECSHVNSCDDERFHRVHRFGASQAPQHEKSLRHSEIFWTTLLSSSRHQPGLRGACWLSQTAHCLEGAIFAAAALRANGHPPLLLDFEAEHDTDHVIAIFRENGCWGAVAKSKLFPGCRWREPFIERCGELALTYFNGYFNLRRERYVAPFFRSRST